MKKVLSGKKLFLLLTLAFLFAGATSAHGQTWVNQTAEQHAAAKDTARSWNDCPKSSSRGGGNLNAEGYSSFSYNNILWETAGALGGVAQTNCTDERAMNFINGSVLGMTSKGIELVYANPPANSGTFVMDTLARAGLVDKAYAQGIGYSALSPLIDVWRVFRNITYILMIVVLVILGFLIMFRRGLDPQTAITIQNSLPRVVVTLILITFSYAIAGFVIDMMYFSIMIVVSVFGQTGIFPASEITRMQQEFLGDGFWGLMRNTFSALQLAPGGKIAGLGWLLAPFTGGASLIAGSLIGGLIEVVREGGDPTEILSTPLSPIVYVLGLLILTFGFFRILFMLIRAYIQILINIIFAPFMLIADVIPGGHGFTNWITNLIGHTLVFPTTAALILIAHAITRNADSLWTPPMIPQVSGSFMITLIGVSMIMIIPSVVAQVQELFKATAPVAAGPGVLAEPVGSTATRLMTIPSLYYTFTGRHIFPFQTPTVEEGASLREQGAEQVKQMFQQ